MRLIDSSLLWLLETNGQVCYAINTAFVRPQVHSVVHANTLGIDNVVVDASTVTGGIAASDTIDLFKVERGTLVLGVRTELITAEGATCTIHIGDGDDPNGYDNSVNINGTPGNAAAVITALGAPGTDAYANGHEYRANDTVAATVNNVMSVAKFKCTLLYVKQDYPFAAADPS